MSKIMYKPNGLVEKICRWVLYSIMTVLTSYILYLRWFVYPGLTKQEFAIELWGEGRWIYLVILIQLLVFLYIRSNLTAFRKIGSKNKDI
jgi:hypothetical protein